MDNLIKTIIDRVEKNNSDLLEVWLHGVTLREKSIARKRFNQIRLSLAFNGIYMKQVEHIDLGGLMRYVILKDTELELFNSRKWYDHDLKIERAIKDFVLEDYTPNKYIINIMGD